MLKIKDFYFKTIMETEEVASCSLKQTGVESASWAVDI